MEDMIIQSLAQAILLLFPAWRIYKKAGLNPATSLTVLIPWLGFFICALILATTKWKTSYVGSNDI